MYLAYINLIQKAMKMESKFTGIKDLYFSFKGRISLAAFWLHAILIIPGFAFLASIIYQGILELIFNQINDNLVLRLIISIPLFIFFGIASLALIIKRCHDRNRSGWFIFIILIPIIGPFWYLIELYFISGTKGENRYGKGPLRIDMKTFSSRFILFKDSYISKFGRSRVLFRLFNILGLILSMAIFTVCLTYYISENTYDQFHKNFKSIFRVEGNAYFDEPFSFIYTPYLMADDLAEEFPQVKYVTRFRKILSDVKCETESVQVDEDQFFLIDTEFFEVFDLEFVLGDRESALKDTNSIVITQNIAAKYFGNSDPRGEVFLVDYGKEYRISAVVEKFPQNSHLNFDFLVLLNPDINTVNNRYNFLYYTYILSEENSTPEEFKNGLADITKKYYSAYDGNFSFYLQPISDIHFSQKSVSDLGTPGNLKKVKLVLASGILLFLFACLNFISLIITRLAENRDKNQETETRKITKKANYIQLIKNGFFGSLVALIVATALAWIIFLLTPGIIESGIESSFKQIVLLAAFVWIAFNFIVLIVGFLFLVVFQYHLGSVIIKGCLAIFQTGVAILFVAITIQVFAQVNFIKNKDLGFDVEDLVIIDITGCEINPATLQKTLTDNQAIESATWISTPLPPSSSANFSIEGAYDNSLIMQVLIAEDDVFNILGIDLIAEKGSSKGIFTGPEAVINETAARHIGNPKDLIGIQLINYYNPPVAYTITGIMKDVNLGSLHQASQPMVVLKSKPEVERFLLVKLESDQKADAVSIIEETSRNVRKGKPFEYSVLQDIYKNFYHKEDIFLKLLFFASLIFIITCCYSIYGILDYLIYYQTRERKVSPYFIHLILTPALIYYSCVISWSFVSLIV